jgi:hypothetical protein
MKHKPLTIFVTNKIYIIILIIIIIVIIPIMDKAITAKPSRYILSLLLFS